MIHVVLYEPEIPPNTGNIARTCAATGVPLHVVEPLGFSISDKHVRRAGLDYWDQLQLYTHPDWEGFVAQRITPDVNMAFISTRGIKRYTRIVPDSAPDGDIYLVFGPETRGLPEEILARWRTNTYRVPMRSGMRSLNLANTAALVLYEALRAQGFPNLE